MSSSDDEQTGTATGIQNYETTATSRRKGDAPESSEKSASKAQKSSHSSIVALPNFITDPNNPVGYVVSTAQQFAGDSVRLVRRCTKPDAKEFKKIAYACAIGFLLMGFIGYIVKLVFIPINNIIVGG